MDSPAFSILCDYELWLILLASITSFWDGFLLDFVFFFLGRGFVLVLWAVGVGFLLSLCARRGIAAVSGLLGSNEQASAGRQGAHGLFC